MKWVSTVLLSVLLLSGCTPQSLLKNTRVENQEEVTASEFVYAPSDFQEAIERLESRKLGTGPEAMQAYLDLSYLYSHHDNPSPDYARAQAALEIYLYLSGEEDQPIRVLNRLALLKKINELESVVEKDTETVGVLREDNRTLMLEIQQLKEKIEVLQNENLAMKQLMERLNQLEMEHEEKRKQVK